MKSRNPNDSSLSRIMINLSVIVVFAALMTGGIIYVYEKEPDIEAEMMHNYARQFTSSATNAHWQWQAQGRPEMIMLVHYDENGREVGRRPVRMAHFGWPKVEPSSASCLQLWEQLLNIPTRVDGFRVLADYYANDNNESEPLNTRCRYRVSTGPYFDYSIYTGRVIQSGGD
ncbi:hypothetical protein [Alteromonas gilva]|uniref:Uncharacterized protein n=1 Tax=Alteromonas gilva TaxID=2987522 RepID=A0ABT5KYM9_9ALTE|nr:hypothetical protein [Alteromonas gilva]MDC8829738.1 hypothetical protein [Alteromonas gilva]